jgi:hypothetical protein
MNRQLSGWEHVPLSGTAFEQFSAPDIVDEHVDVAMVVADLLGQAFYLVGVEMVGCDRDTSAAESRDEVGSFFDRLGTISAGSSMISAPRKTSASSKYIRANLRESNSQ